GGPHLPASTVGVWIAPARQPGQGACAAALTASETSEQARADGTVQVHPAAGQPHLIAFADQQPLLLKETQRPLASREGGPGACAELLERDAVLQPQPQAEPFRETLLGAELLPSRLGQLPLS